MRWTQIVERNTWIRIDGTDLEVLVDGGEDTAPVEVEVAALREDSGRLDVQATCKIDDAVVVLRVPASAAFTGADRPRGGLE